MPHVYILKSVPGNTNDSFLPTYFGDETEITKAIPITLDDNIYDVDIHLIPGSATSTLDMNFSRVIIFPNPAGESFNISSEGDYEYINIYDMYGNICAHFNNNGNYIPIKDLNSGIYTIGIKFKNGFIFKNFVKL